MHKIRDLSHPNENVDLCTNTHLSVPVWNRHVSNDIIKWHLVLVFGVCTEVCSESYIILKNKRQRSCYKTIYQATYLPVLKTAYRTYFLYSPRKLKIPLYQRSVKKQTPSIVKNTTVRHLLAPWSALHYSISSSFFNHHYYSVCVAVKQERKQKSLFGVSHPGGFTVVQETSHPWLF